jgi:glycosyltransferase involved in cell wall biosynthesis
MKILWLIHGYPPIHNAGAEWMAHAMNKMMMKRGAEIRVMFRTNKRINEFEGVEIGDIEHMNLVQTWVDWADLVFTHLDCQGFAADICRQKQKQLVAIVHNTLRDELYHPRFRKNWLIINTDWIAKEKHYEDFEAHGSKASMRTIVVHPPVIKEDYEVESTNEVYTLVNLNENKGGDLFYEVAKRLPKIKFLGVVGSYATQFKESLPNLEIMGNTPNIKEALSRTKCLMCLSRNETFGRAGLEAMVSGIPVISTQTPGTLEAYGDAALYVDRNVEAIIKGILKMEKEHEKYSKLAAKQYASFDFEKEIDNLMIWLNDKV